VEIAGGDRAQTASFLTLQGVQAGDKVRLTYPNGIQREYRVKGIFQAKEMLQADRLAFVTRIEIVSVLGKTVILHHLMEDCRMNF
jgi:putative ABC transport system permease protein